MQQPESLDEGEYPAENTSTASAMPSLTAKIGDEELRMVTEERKNDEIHHTEPELTGIDEIAPGLPGYRVDSLLTKRPHSEPVDADWAMDPLTGRPRTLEEL